MNVTMEKSSKFCSTLTLIRLMSFPLQKKTEVIEQQYNDVK